MLSYARGPVVACAQEEEARERAEAVASGKLLSALADEDGGRAGRLRRYVDEDELEVGAG